MDNFYTYFLIVSLIFYIAGFMVKNIRTALRTKQVIRGKSIKVKLTSIITLSLYCMIATNSLIFTDLFYRTSWLDQQNIRVIGVIVVFLSIILGYVSLFTIKDSWRIGILPEQKNDLITNGIFRYSRNPYFTSQIFMFLGYFLLTASYVFLIIYLTWIYLIYLLIKNEEQYLNEQHGDFYIDYKKRVNRYFTIK